MTTQASQTPIDAMSDAPPHSASQKRRGTEAGDSVPVGSTSVEVVETLTDFERLRPAWEALYDRDPNANVFRSWPWLAGWLEASPNPWRVLAVRERDGQALAFLALSAKPQPGRWGRGGEVLYLAGHPITNHTGLLAHPEAEAEVLSALAGALAEAPWRAISFELTDDPRVAALAGRLAGRGAQLERGEGEESPYLELPRSFESYLETHFSGKAQRELRRRQRKAEALGLRLETLEPGGDLERYLDAFLTLHQRRFGPVAPRHEAMYRAIFGRMLAAGGLHTQLLQVEGEPVAAQIGFLDHKNGVYHGCQGGWDERYAELAPGLLIKLEAIRYAIARGFAGFDLGRGEHAYKYGLGGAPRRTAELRLTRLSLAQRLKRSLVPARAAEARE